MVVPTDIDSTWVRQVMQPPLVVGPDAFVATPGVRAIESMSAETGQLRWRRVFDNLETIVGVNRSVLIVRTAKAYLGLNHKTGKQVWELPRKPGVIAEGEVLHGNHLVFAQPVNPSKDNKLKQAIARLVWFDLVSRRIVGHTQLANLTGKSPSVGPFFFAEGKWWSYFATSPLLTDRELIEWLPTKDHLDPPTAATIDSKWLHQIEQPMVKTTAFAPWKHLLGAVGTRSNATVLRMNNTARRSSSAIGFQLPPGSKLKQLILEAEEATPSVHVQVMQGGKVLHDRPAAAKNEKAKSLARVVIPLNGQRGWITVSVIGVGKVIWKKLEVK